MTHYPGRIVRCKQAALTSGSATFGIVLAVYSSDGNSPNERLIWGLSVRDTPRGRASRDEKQRLLP